MIDLIKKNGNQNTTSEITRKHTATKGDIMWTGFKENTEYSAQITPYHNEVHAEIIVRDKNKDKGFHEHNSIGGLWLTVMDKSFGSKWFTDEPTEDDWKNAVNWVETQLTLIEKYGTVMVTKPAHIRRSENAHNTKDLK